MNQLNQNTLESKWSESDKALWILEHGLPAWVWTYYYDQTNNHSNAREPVPKNNGKVPPWVSKREYVGADGQYRAYEQDIVT